MKNKKNRYVTKMNLYIRILVAGYVAYLAYDLIPSVKAAVGNEKIWMGIAVVLLGLAGVSIVILSVKHLICKEYYDADEIADIEAAENADTTDDKTEDNTTSSEEK